MPHISVSCPVWVALVMSVRPIRVKAQRKLPDCCSFGRLLMVSVSCGERRLRQWHGQDLVVVGGNVIQVIHPALAADHHVKCLISLPTKSCSASAWCGFSIAARDPICEGRTMPLQGELRDK